MSRSLMLLYAFHGLFWGVFAVRVLLGRRAIVAGAGASSAAPARVETAASARHPRLFVRLHGVAIFVMYFAIGDALFGRARLLFFAQPIVGATIIAAGAALALWALVFFRSWRYAAKLDVGHELATGGPFAWLRHPIYAAIDLLALGSFVWLPTLPLLVGFVAVAVVADARARKEERLLVEAFGDRYRQYMQRVRRFVPFVY
jgi:protein-S-isoprenylcysteine O-methyltransferase Ste14